MLRFGVLLLALGACVTQGTGQQPTALLRPAREVALPSIIDGNSAAFWANGRMHLLHSSGVPTISEGADQFALSRTRNIVLTDGHPRPVWFEGVWRDDDGTLFLWYHHEPPTLCGNGSSLTSPVIGAAISFDDGRTVSDLGIILESGDATDCNSQNGFFSGGHGDFSVIRSEDGNYFYFLFTNYAGPRDEQGVGMARLAFEDRFHPAGAVQKYYRGTWSEPGIWGHVEAIFPAGEIWQLPDTDSYWGASVHWNSAINSYVALLNRACCAPGWPQEGIYISFNDDIANPWGWSSPQLLLDGEDAPYAPNYYPQVLGLKPGETDTLASEVARFYLQGRSRWEIVFRRDSNGASSGGELPDGGAGSAGPPQP